jgi:hypothetical protein
VVSVCNCFVACTVVVACWHVAGALVRCPLACIAWLKQSTCGCLSDVFVCRLFFVMASFVADAQQKASGCVACVFRARVTVCICQAVLQHAFGEAGHACCTVLIAGNFNNSLPSANTADVSFAVGVRGLYLFCVASRELGPLLTLSVRIDGTRWPRS